MMRPEILVALCVLLSAAPVWSAPRHAQDEAMTVAAPQAELRGRPAMSSTVLGLLRRGESVQVVRHSADGRWVEVDIGAGELAWIDARAVRSGRVPALRERAPAPAPAARLADAGARLRMDPPPEREDMRRIETSREERIDAAAHRGAPVVTETARPPRAEVEVEIVRALPPPLPPHGNNYFDLHVDLGVAIPQHRVATNGISTSVLPAYAYSTTNLAAGVRLGYSRAAGRFRFHLDGKYLLSALGAVRYQDGTQLALRDQNVGAGIAIGGYFAAAGGVDLRLRVGVEAWISEITPSAPPLAISSETTLGMAAGLELGMPAIFRVAGRPFGFRARAGALAPAQQKQYAGLGTGAQAKTYGAYAGGSVQMGLLSNPRHGQVHLEARYDYSMVLSRYGGVCAAGADGASGCRDMSVSSARNGFVAQVATLGVYYQY